jgi:hypothetical protein
MRNFGIAVFVGIALVLAFVVGATFFEPKHEGPFEKMGEKVDRVIKK